MCGPEDPLFTPLLPLARVPFQAKESVHKTPFWENLEIFSSQAPKFGNFQLTSPQNLEIFSSQAPKFGNFPLTSPPFQRQMSVRKPHTSEIRAAHPYLKKSWVPPPGPLPIVKGHFGRKGTHCQGFFSKFLMGGDLKFSVPVGDEVGWGACKKNPTEAKTPHLMQN